MYKPNIKKTFPRAAMMLLMMMLTAATAWAQSTENLGGYDFTVVTDGNDSTT